MIWPSSISGSMVEINHLVLPIKFISSKNSSSGCPIPTCQSSFHLFWLLALCHHVFLPQHYYCSWCLFFLSPCASQPFSQACTLSFFSSHALHRLSQVIWVAQGAVKTMSVCLCICILRGLPLVERVKSGHKKPFNWDKEPGEGGGDIYIHIHIYVTVWIDTEDWGLEDWMEQMSWGSRWGGANDNERRRIDNGQMGTMYGWRDDE